MSTKCNHTVTHLNLVFFCKFEIFIPFLKILFNPDLKARLDEDDCVSIGIDCFTGELDIKPWIKGPAYAIAIEWFEAAYR